MLIIKEPTFEKPLNLAAAKQTIEFLMETFRMKMLHTLNSTRNPFFRKQPR